MLFWGSQGLKRNIGAALEYLRMGAETQDPQAMYDYGIILLRVSLSDSISAVYFHYKYDQAAVLYFS